MAFALGYLGFWRKAARRNSGIGTLCLVAVSLPFACAIEPQPDPASYPTAIPTPAPATTLAPASIPNAVESRWNRIIIKVRKSHNENAVEGGEKWLYELGIPGEAVVFLDGDKWPSVPLA